MKGLVRFVSLLEDGTPEDVSFPPGVLPLPKPDENQTDFISVGDVYQMPFFALPVTNSEPSAACRLPEAMPLSAFLAQTRTALSAPDMRYYDAGRRVEYLALCGGAGGDILYEAAQRGCDTVLTGEIKHHQWIDGAELGLNLMEGGHFATENVVMPSLAEMLRQGFPEVDVCLSRLQGPLSRGFGF